MPEVEKEERIFAIFAGNGLNLLQTNLSIYVAHSIDS